MGKLIAKTAAITLACIIAAALLLFGIFSLFFPSVMMSLTDSLGMEGACASYTVSVYDKTGKTEDLALAVERSYLAGHYEDAAKYGVIFLDSEDFSAFCSKEDEKAGSSAQYLRGSSAQYYTGIVAVSLYECSDAGAIDIAFAALGDAFPENNAVIYLATAAMEKEDTEFCRQILDRLDSLSPVSEDADKLADFQSALQEFCA